MGVVLAMRAKLAAEVRKHLEGHVYVIDRARLSRTPDDQMACEGPTQIARLVARKKAHALAIDVTLGGQRYAAMDAVRALLDGEDPHNSAPAVVTLVPSITLPFARHAWELGVFAVIECLDRTPDQLAKPIADEIYRAIAWRDGLGPQRLPWLGDVERRLLKRSASASRPLSSQRRRATR